MGISLETMDNRWDTPSQGRNIIYDLAHTATCSADAAERIRAIGMLGQSDDPRAVRPLTDLLGDPDSGIRLGATIALGHLKSGRPVDDLLSRLRDRDEDAAIRRQTVMTLAAIRSTGAIQGLREFAADQDEDPALRESVRTVLREIGMVYG